MRGSAPHRGWGQPEVGHPVRAVHVPGVDGVLEEGTGGTDPHRHVGPADQLEHGQGVAHDVDERGVAADAGDRREVEPGVQRREEQGAGVVDAGVDVEHDGDSLHGDDHGGCGGPTRYGVPACRPTSGIPWIAGRSRSVIG